MPIDVFEEPAISFADLARRLSAGRDGPRVAVSTIHRWRRPGIRGVRLEAVKIGAAWHTTRSAFSRFCAALTEDADSEARPAVSEEHSAAERRLDNSGW
jgi:hypothetical protein